MPRKQATTIGAYSDCVRILDAAIAGRGGSLPFAHRGKAMHFRQRCYRLRKLLQEVNAAPGVLPHSPYDELIIKITPIEGKISEPATLHFEFRDTEIIQAFIPAEAPTPADSPLLDAAKRFAKKIEIE